MKYWNEYPLYRLLIPMILGIISASFLESNYFSIILLLIAFSLFIFWVFRPSFLRKYGIRFIGGIIISFLFYIFGLQLLWVKTSINHENHYTQLDSISHFVINVNSPIIEKKNSFKSVGKVIAAYQEDDTIAISVTGIILLYFEKETFPDLKYGDELLISNKCNIISGYGNPNEFDYAAYLKKQGIYHQMYLNRTDWIRTNHSSPNLIMQWSLQIRDLLLGILKDFHFSDPEFAVASAILLGYDEYLDQDLRQLYAGSGAMHILCVSGLHVGIIFMMFNTLLAFIKRMKYGVFIHAFLQAIVIWFYAFITGLSPSVFRAATMFTFVTIGQTMNRKTSTYNSLAASAFVLLIVDPYLLFHIGFQLSYLAVFAILILQPPLSSLWKTKQSILVKIRDLFAVSIAAQVGTFPLAIFYFHLFPNYFLFTNLMVIPLSFFILIAGFVNIFIFLLGLGSSYLGWFITKLLFYSLWILNQSMDFINRLPAAVSENLFFTILDTLLVYLLIVFLILSLLRKKSIYVFLLFANLIILFGINSIFRYQSAHESSISIFNIPKHSLIDISYGRQSLIIADSLLKNDSTNIDQILYSSHLSKRINNKKMIDYESMNNFTNDFVSLSKNQIVFGAKKIFIIDENNLVPSDNYPLIINYLIFRNNPRTSIQKARIFLNFDTIIFDASNAFWNINKWKIECDSLNIPYWDTKEKGALIIKAPLL